MITKINEKIFMAKEIVNKEKSLLCRNMDFVLRKRLVKCYALLRPRNVYFEKREKRKEQDCS